MAPTILPSGEAWALAARQHGVVARRQLLALGFTSEAIRHRLATGRLHPLWRGVYAVNQAGFLHLIDPEVLRAELDRRAPRPGVGPLRRLLDRSTFTLTATLAAVAARLSA